MWLESNLLARRELAAYLWPVAIMGIAVGAFHVIIEAPAIKEKVERGEKWW
jgi:hypothetical protein